MSQNQSNQGPSNDSGNKGEKEADNRKQSLYFPAAMLQALQEEAARLDRSMSWVVQRCIKVALPSIRALPSMDDTGEL